MGLLIVAVAASCKKQEKNGPSLSDITKELNEGPDRNLETGIFKGSILTGCEYTVGDTIYTYIIKVPDNRFNKMEVDSIKTNVAKSFSSDEKKRIINLLNRENIGLKYRLQLPEKEISIEFSKTEIADISRPSVK